MRGDNAEEQGGNGDVGERVGEETGSLTEENEGEWSEKVGELRGGEERARARNNARAHARTFTYAHALTSTPEQEAST